MKSLSGPAVRFFALALTFIPIQATAGSVVDLGKPTMTAQHTQNPEVIQKRADGTVALWEVKPLDRSGVAPPGTQPNLSSKTHLTQVVLEFLAAHRDIIKLANPARELKIESVQTDNLGLSHVRLAQVYQGILVKGAELIVHLDPKDKVYRVNGQYIPTPSHIELRPGLTLGQAFAVAARDLGLGDCPDCRGELIIYQTPPKETALAWQIKTSAAPDKAWTIVVDAVRGEVLQKTTSIHHSQ